MNDIPCKLPFHLQWEKYVQMIDICFLFTIPYCDTQNSSSAVVPCLQGQILPWDKESKSEIFWFHKCTSLIKNYTRTYLILSRYMQIIFPLCGLYSYLRLCLCSMILIKIFSMERKYIFVFNSMASGVRLPRFKYQLWFVQFCNSIPQFPPLKNRDNRKIFVCEFNVFRFYK